jgi:hypothetical protein
VTAPTTLAPALAAGGLAAVYEHSKGRGVDSETVAMVGGSAAFALGVSLMIEEQNYTVGGLLALVGAWVAYQTRA